MPRRQGRRWGCWLLLLLVLAAAVLAGWTEYQRLLREHPEQFPWTPLSLADPIGPFTARKLAALTGAPDRCFALLGDVPRQLLGSVANPQCRVSDGVRVDALSGPKYRPSGLVAACPVVAALKLWERDVVGPAARRHFGAAIATIDHAGSYSCRRIYGRSEGRFSEHATADAVDITGFRLADGRRISVLDDWNERGAAGAFLREVRDGACDLFATVLSPEYNDAHADHFHLDQAGRGASGWRRCS
ncbi:extensin family protein [Sphingomonas xanthus]|uniref:Extensin family protein n=1 Tax=Sphingomonas xanthus TaxID=2594473 RepID=A0A516IT39_9SPHN|nr:extensin family protein [Sphingomonas xanthus]QDP20059.1 extensin family protein [Sphingomonas xanthus]